MAFISEVNFRGNNISVTETVEITLLPGDDPNDFVISAYDDEGDLHLTSGLATGEVNLGTLTGIPHPSDPAWTIYTIELGIRNANADADEATAVALTNIDTGEVIDFFGAERVEVNAGQGAASGATSETVLDHTIIVSGESFQQDHLGNTFNATISSGESIICLVGCAVVKGANGAFKNAQDVEVGDMIWTLDQGPLPVTWVGQTEIDFSAGHVNPSDSPVLISPGALGTNLPARPLRVSPQHRVLLRSKIAERIFDVPEVLVAAKKLVGLPGISQPQSRATVTYVHIAFDDHQVIEADGALVESLFLGPMVAKAANEPNAMFAKQKPSFEQSSALCRPVARGKLLKRLLERHAKNEKPLVSAEPVSIAS